MQKQRRTKSGVVMVLFGAVHVAHRIKYLSCSILERGEHELGLKLFLSNGCTNVKD